MVSLRGSNADQAFRFDVDLDLAFHFDADLDPIKNLEVGSGSALDLDSKTGRILHCQVY